MASPTLNRSKDLAIAVLIWGLLLAPFMLGGLWAYSHISVCGWKGLFVECRIMECPKP